jgi:ribosomal protein S18 acetylase RimI-like enzyme
MDICILPAWRGRGTGTSVLKDVLAQASLAGLPVTVHVERFNPALAWYQRLGFRLAEDRGVYLFLKWEPD